MSPAAAIEGPDTLEEGEVIERPSTSNESPAFAPVADWNTWKASVWPLPTAVYANGGNDCHADDVVTQLIFSPRRFALVPSRYSRTRVHTVPPGLALRA